MRSAEAERRAMRVVRIGRSSKEEEEEEEEERRCISIVSSRIRERKRKEKNKGDSQTRYNNNDSNEVERNKQEARKEQKEKEKQPRLSKPPSHMHETPKRRLKKPAVLIASPALMQHARYMLDVTYGWLAARIYMRMSRC